jgi:hypothetical protein
MAWWGSMIDQKNGSGCTVHRKELMCSNVARFSGGGESFEGSSVTMRRFGDWEYQEY